MSSIANFMFVLGSGTKSLMKSQKFSSSSRDSDDLVAGSSVAGSSLAGSSTQSSVIGKLSKRQVKRKRDLKKQRVLAHQKSLTEVELIKQYWPGGLGPDNKLQIGKDPLRKLIGLRKADFTSYGFMWSGNGLKEDTVNGNLMNVVILMHILSLFIFQNLDALNLSSRIL